MKSVLVIGIGRFGYHLIDQLSKAGDEILAVDTSEERLEPVLGMVTSSLIGDATNEAFITSLFESASAVGTVGLSMGITPGLHTVSKFILIILMYTGRVGGLTLVFAAITRKSLGNRQYPADNIAVG